MKIQISDTVLFPAAGMLIMAIEAVQQQTAGADRTVTGYLLEQADFLNPIIVQEAWEDRTEVQVHLQPVKKKGNHGNEAQSTSFEVAIFSYPRNGQWSQCFRAGITVEYDDKKENELRQVEDETVRGLYTQALKLCRFPIDSQLFYRDAAEHGLQYGDWFQLLHDIRWDGSRTAVADVEVSRARYQSESLVHPTLLDTAFHVLRVSAGQEPAANVPVRLERAWFSAEGWQRPGNASVRWLATSNRAGSTSSRSGFEKLGYNGEDGTLYAMAADGTVLCVIKKALTAAVSRGSRADAMRQDKKQAKKLLYSIEWKPQLSLLEPQQLARVCGADVFTRDETAIVANHADLCAALDLVAVRTLKHLDRSSIPDNHLQRHVDWMEHHVATLTPARRQEGETIRDADLEARLLRVEAALPAWKLYTACARQLGAILAGDVDPLQVVFESDLANIFYASLFQNLCADGRLATFLDLASHENPAMRILEVGAGTGGMTGHVLNALQAREARTGAPSFAEYTYTDISPVFFERARSRWPDLHKQGRMTFRPLDLDRPVGSQGVEPGSYDMVIAASVLHATPYLEATLRNVRAALRPGGRLVLVEVINPADVATNFMAGLVPGWWVAGEEWRPHSAAVTELVWDALLRANGFSGNDMLLRDYRSDECHIMSVIVSTANEAEGVDIQSRSKTPALQQTRRVVLVVDETAPEHQIYLAGLVGSRLGPGWQTTTVCPFSTDQLPGALEELTEDDAVICLIEVRNRPLLANLSEQNYACLQQLIKHAPRLMWATAPNSSDDPLAAHYGVAQGFLRSIRAEQGVSVDGSRSRLVNVAIEGAADAALCADWIAKVFLAAFGPSTSSEVVPGEVEYVVRDGLLMMGRAVENVAGNEALRSLLKPQLRQAVWEDIPGVQLSVGTQGGSLASDEPVFFVRDATHSPEADIGPDEVEIAAKAWSLNQDDIQADSPSQETDDYEPLPGPISGCAGVITRMGRNCGRSLLQPGDRVCMLLTAGNSVMRKYPRAHHTAVTKMPPATGKLSFEAAAASLVPGITAYHALADVARLRPGMSVLVHHAAASGVGQMAVRIARFLGADRIFTTTTTSSSSSAGPDNEDGDEERRLLIETLGIPAEDIFPSRPAAAFARGVRRATRGRAGGVDVVFNSAALVGLGDETLLRALCECLAPGGHLLEVGGASVTADAAATVPVSALARNITFSVVRPEGLSLEAAGRLASTVMRLLGEQDGIQTPRPLHVFDVSRVNEALKQVRGGRPATGGIVVCPRDQEVVSVSDRPRGSIVPVTFLGC